MKGFIFVFALLALAATAFSKPPPEFRQFMQECETELGITKPPRRDSDDTTGKCFHACLMRKMGTLADGKVVLEKELEKMNQMPDVDEAKKAKMTECVEKANAESDECEVAHTMKKCMMDNDLVPHRGGPRHHD